MAAPAPIPQRSYVFQPAKAAVGAQVNHELDTLYAVLQGGVADAHISGQANISGSKLAPGSVPLAQLTQDAAFQPGMIIHYALSTVPLGWLSCDGSAVSRATYVNLFSEIGTTFGSGDGTSTFNLPPQGVVMVNLSATDTNFESIGQTGGEDTHLLTSGEMPVHSHPVNDPGHTHAMGGSGGALYQKNNLNFTGSGLNVWSPDVNGSALVPQATTTGIGIINAGNNEFHNNLQPYVVVPMIIKY